MEGRTELPLGTTHGLAEDYQLLSQNTRVVRGMLSRRIHTLLSANRSTFRY